MKRFKLLIPLFTALMLLSPALLAQGLTIGSGTTLSLGSSTLTLPGNWNNSGTFNAGTGTVVFNGASGNQTITNSSGETFYNITVNKASGDVQAASQLTVNGTITVSSGDLDLNNFSILLGNSALASETAGNTIKGGEISGTTSLNAPSSVNVFGLGAIISSSEDLGSTSIIRGHAVQESNSTTSILRYYVINPTNNSNLDASLVFSYDESELNSHNENNLMLFRSTDDGISWGNAGGTVNASSNTVSLAGINSFSTWTVSSESAFPVELVSFTAAASANDVELKWQTATETDNYGFEVERKKQKSDRNQKSEQGSDQWETLGFVKGSGNSSSMRQYSFTDNFSKIRFAGKVQYRLKQIDNDGSYSYSDITETEVAAPKEFVLYNNYPNPFNPETIIEFTVPENTQAQLKIYNITGEEVATLFKEFAEAGKYYRINFNASSLSAGIYFARLQSGNNISIKKMTYLK